jgi:hypothetical protein
MAKILTPFGCVVVMLIIVLDFLAILFDLGAKEDLLELTGMILSWPAVAGATAAGVSWAYKDEIKILLKGKK